MSPFEKTSATDKPMRELGELALLKKIRRALGEAAPPCPEGPGDDCAVLECECEENFKQLFTVDSLVYKKHFDDSLTAFQAGEKLLKRNVSDIAAMAGTATVGVTAVVCGGDVSEGWLLEFCRGLSAAALRHGVRLVGGDLAQGDAGTFSASLSLLGKAKHPVTRKGARPGDLIFVTGKLGGSLAGWHYEFKPRVKEALWLAEHFRPNAMMDLTDGLAKDLPQLLPENCDAFLETNALPISPAVTENPLVHALSDGEDYELLFTLPEGTDIAALMKKWNENFSTPLTCIGKIERAHDDKDGKRLRDARTKELLNAKGFSHFQ